MKILTTGRTWRLVGADRVFFLDEAAAIAAGFSPCAVCMPERHREWARRAYSLRAGRRP